MIELIFAIVIMGIVFLSVPMLIKTAERGNTVALQQESIAILAQHLNALSTYAWDEENTQSKGHYGILDTNSTTAAFLRDGNLTPGATRLREGNSTARIYASLPSSFGLGIDTEPIPGVLESINDDIDDFDDSNYTLTLANADSAVTALGDYVDKTVEINTTVSYYQDAPSDPTLNSCATAGGCAYSNPQPVGTATQTSNVKFVTSTLASDVFPEKVIRMKIFVSNIGSPVIKEAIK